MTDTIAAEAQGVEALQVAPNGDEPKAELPAQTSEPSVPVDKPLVKDEAAPATSNSHSGPIEKAEVIPVIVVEHGNGENLTEGGETIQDGDEYKLEDVKATRIASDHIDATFRGHCIGLSPVAKTKRKSGEN